MYEKKLIPPKPLPEKKQFILPPNSRNETNDNNTEFTDFVFSFGYLFLFDLKKNGRGKLFCIRSTMIPWLIMFAQSF
jgi:hypothetical protein